MSRTQKTNDRPVNPCEKFFQWDSENSCWSYWDKEAKERVKVAMDIPFIVLDQLSTVTGYSDKLNSGIWGNEVRNPSRDQFRVMAGNKNEVARGTWAEVKNYPGIKFAASVYAMAKLDGEFILANFRMSGCSISPWIDFSNEVGKTALEGDLVIAVTEAVEGKKGRVTFNSPKFAVKATSLSEEASKQADELDRKLQAYLEDYFGQEPAYFKEAEEKAETQGEDEPVTVESSPAADEDDDCPF